MNIKPKIVITSALYLLLAILVLIVSLGNLSSLSEALFYGVHDYCSRNSSSESLLIANFLILPLYIFKLVLVFFVRDRVRKNIKEYSCFSYTTKIGTYFNRVKLALIFLYPISLLLGVVLPCAFIT